MSAHTPRKWLLVLLLAAAAIGCNPEPRCGGELYFDPDNVSCRPCPKDATLEHGTCVCNDGKTFVEHRCVLPDGGTPALAPDAGAEANSCNAYCDFVKQCLADNTLAASALPEVITGLHADEPATCAASCGTARGEDQEASPLARCVEDGREAAQCAGDTTQTGLRSALMLLGQCARANMSDPLRGLICMGLKQSTLVSSQIDFCD